jgi:hypothetical protein
MKRATSFARSRGGSQFLTATDIQSALLKNLKLRPRPGGLTLAFAYGSKIGSPGFFLFGFFTDKPKETALMVILPLIYRSQIVWSDSKATFGAPYWLCRIHEHSFCFISRLTLATPGNRHEKSTIVFAIFYADRFMSTGAREMKNCSAECGF